MGTEKPSLHEQYNTGKLFLLSVVALVTTAFAFSLRASSLSGISDSIFQGGQAQSSEWLTGLMAGAAFLGFAISIFLGSPLCDYLGMGRLLGLACVLHIAGTVAAVMTKAGPGASKQLYFSMLVIGFGNGLVEAVINPLAATVYPNDKTHRLNVLHAWWPGGLILGGLLGFGLDRLGLGWQVKLACVLIPAVIYGAMLIGTRFPPTERVAAGVSAGAMLREAVNPLFILLFCCMLVTASSELAPGQWLDAMLTRVVGFQGILLLVYVSAIMFVARHFAGSLAHRLSPIGLMWVSCLLASMGLLLLSQASSPITALVAATVFAFGVCYMWPTMLGITSERFPRGGAFLIGLMGCAGNVGTSYTLPLIGRVFDGSKIEAAKAHGYATFDALTVAAKSNPTLMNDVLVAASRPAFRFVAMLPIPLLVIFGIWWFVDKSRGGYRAVKLTAQD